MTDPIFTDYRAGPVTCPGCGAELDGHLALQSSDGPIPDSSAAVCADCGALAVYTTVNGQLALRRPTDDEEIELLRNPRMQGAIQAVREMRES